MKNRYRVFSEHQPKKANLWEEEVFHRCYQKLKCYVFCSVGFFSLQYLHPCICNTFGKSYWKHSWWWLPGGRQSIVPKLTQKAYSSDEKNELKETVARIVCTIHRLSCLQGVWNKIGSALSPLGPKINQAYSSQVPPSPGSGSLASHPIQTSQITPIR